MPNNKKPKQKQIARKVAKMIGAAAVLSPLVFAIPVSIGAVVPSPPPSDTVTTLVAPSPSPSVTSSPGNYEPPNIINHIQSQITSQLAGQTFQVGDSLTIDLSDIFEDADLLDYHVIVQNPNVAEVSIDNETDTLIISMNKKGTTMVTLTAKYKNQPAIQLDRFRITGDTPSLLDINDDNKIRVDEIVKYMNDHPGKNANDYKSLLNTVKPYIPQVNLAPIVHAGEITELDVPLNGSIALSLDDFFSDPDGDLLTYSFESPLPSSGSSLRAQFDNTSNILTLTGQSYSSQALTLTVIADDQQSTPTSTATHQFQVKVDYGTPVAQPDYYSLNANTTLTVDAASGVLHNDWRTDPYSILTAMVDTGPVYGQLSMFSDGGFNYIPNAGFAGTDSFTYIVWNGSNYSEPTKVTITVNEVSSSIVEIQDIGLKYMVSGDGIYNTEIDLEDIFTYANEYRIVDKSYGLEIYDDHEGGWFPGSSGSTMLYVSTYQLGSSTIQVEARSSQNEVPASYLIQLRTNQAPEFKGYRQFGIKKGATISLYADEWFEDPDGDPITTFAGSVIAYGSSSVTVNNPNPSTDVITVTAGVYKEYGTQIRFSASDGLPDGDTENEYDRVDVVVVDEVLSFGKGERKIEYDISSYLAGMNSESITATLRESYMIESVSLLDTTLHLLAREDTFEGAEAITIELFDGENFKDVELFVEMTVDEKIEFMPGSLSTSLNIDSYLSGMTGTVTANVYSETQMLESVSVSGSNLELIVDPNNLIGEEVFQIQVTDGVITKYIRFRMEYPFDGYMFFAEDTLMATTHIGHLTSGITGNISAEIVGGSHPFIDSVMLSGNDLTLIAHTMDEGYYFGSIMIELTGENGASRRLAFYLYPEVG